MTRGNGSMVEITQIHDDASFEEAARVIQTAFSDTKAKNNVVFAISDIDGAYLKRLIEEKSGVCFAALKDNAIVGTLSIVKQNVKKWFFSGETLKIRLVAVLPQYYGEHIGSQLVSSALAYSKENHYSMIIVQTPANNIPAQKLYEKFGFVKVGYWRNKDHDVIDYVWWSDNNRPSRAKTRYMCFRAKAIAVAHRLIKG